MTGRRSQDANRGKCDRHSSSGTTESGPARRIRFPATPCPGSNDARSAALRWTGLRSMPRKLPIRASSEAGSAARSSYRTIAVRSPPRVRDIHSTEAFDKSLIEDVSIGGMTGTSVGLKKFADTRRAYLLNYQPPAIAP